MEEQKRLACCGHTDPREKAKWRAELCLLTTYFPSHRALPLGVGGQIKEGVEGMVEAVFPILVFPKSGGSHPKGQDGN